MGYDEQLLYEVAKMYYIDNRTQAEISEQFNLSRPKISRLLSRAREDGIVQISLTKPSSDGIQELEDRLKELLGLKNILVFPTFSSDEGENIRSMAPIAAKFFTHFIEDGDKIGVSWGYTLLEIAKSLPVSTHSDASIVQIAGNLDNADSTNFANEIIRQFGEKMYIDHKSTLPCPIMVENSIIVDLLMHDTKIGSIIDQINSVNVAFVNVGILSENNCLCRTGFITPDNLCALQSKGAVGCICSRFINIDGELTDADYDRRTIGITLSALKSARISCACIASDRKILPLLGAIRGGLINTIVIDSNSALQLANLVEG